MTARQTVRETRRSGVVGTPVMLRDGSMVLVRPIQPADAPLLVEGFARLSPESRRRRFLIGKHALSSIELRYLTEIDHHDHEAVGALDHADGRGVGIARYVRDAEDPELAEVAITVIDEWQRRGVGTELVAALSERARAAGIRRFGALVSADNLAVIGLLRRMSADVELVGTDGDVLQYEVVLRAAAPQPAAVPWWVTLGRRAKAGGSLRVASEPC